MLARADQQRAAAFGGAAASALLGDCRELSPGSVRVRAERGGVEVNVRALERDRLGRAQSTSGEQLQAVRGCAARLWLVTIPRLVLDERPRRAQPVPTILHGG